MKISTGIPIFNTPVDPQGTENQSPNAIFHVGSKSLMSHIIDVSETAIIVKAYGFVNDASTITVCTVTTEKDGLNYAAPMVLNGRHVQLSNRNNVLVIDMTGKYAFQLSDGLGATTCAYHESALGLWSFGLSAYATANGMLEFIETETVKPVVLENQVREYVKLSSYGAGTDQQNLLQIRSDGLYYGIAPPANFVTQYVSSSHGSNNPLTNDGSHDRPWKSIHYAVSNLPEGTSGHIYLYRGDVFYTYLDNATTLATTHPNMDKPGNGTDGVITDLDFFPALNLMIGGVMDFGNRKIMFTVYDDPAVDAVFKYMADTGIYGYDPYLIREINRPIIKFVSFLAHDSGQYITAAIGTGVGCNISFQGIKLQTTVCNAANPQYTWGCFAGNGSIGTEGGDIHLGSIPLMGGPNSGGNIAFAISHAQISKAAAPDTPKFNHSSSYLNMVTFSDYTGGPGSGAYVPTLPYTKNGNNVESFLAPLSFWPGMVIYGGVIRDAAGNPVVPAAHISGSDLRNYRRVRTDIKIIDPANPAP